MKRLMLPIPRLQLIAQGSSVVAPLHNYEMTFSVLIQSGPEINYCLNAPKHSCPPPGHLLSQFEPASHPAGGVQGVFSACCERQLTWPGNCYMNPA